MFKRIILFIIISLFSFSSVFAWDYYDWMNKCSVGESYNGAICEDIWVIYKLSVKSRLKISEIISMLNKYPNDKKILFVDKLKSRLDTNQKNTFPYDLISVVIANIKIDENKVVILEWYNIYDIDTYLFEKWLIEKWAYVSYVQNKDKIFALSKFFHFLDNQETMEWYLYPDTYDINKSNFKINEFVIKQLDAFEMKVYNKLFLDENKTPKYNNNIINSIINLASIVEKEERDPLEKPTVAWILKKRVKEWWHIWADITVCYPYKLTSNECKLVISKYIWVNTDYNTRFISWLPPTPISNPSYETINATLNDKKTSYYYYLHDTKTWKVYYANTLEEHNKNKELYIK